NRRYSQAMPRQAEDPQDRVREPGATVEDRGRPRLCVARQDCDEECQGDVERDPGYGERLQRGGGRCAEEVRSDREEARSDQEEREERQLVPCAAENDKSRSPPHVFGRRRSPGVTKERAGGRGWVPRVVFKPCRPASEHGLKTTRGTRAVGWAPPTI